MSGPVPTIEKSARCQDMSARPLSNDIQENHSQICRLTSETFENMLINWSHHDVAKTYTQPTHLLINWCFDELHDQCTALWLRIRALMWSAKKKSGRNVVLSEICPFKLLETFWCRTYRSRWCMQWVIPEWMLLDGYRVDLTRRAWWLTQSSIGA